MSYQSIWDKEKLDEFAREREEQEIKDGVNVYKFKGCPIDNMKLLMQNSLNDLEEFVTTPAGQIQSWVYQFKFFDNWRVVAKHLDEDVKATLEALAKETGVNAKTTTGVQFKFRQDAISYAETCRNRCDAIRRLTGSAVLYKDTGFYDDFEKVMTAGQECKDTFDALEFAYKKYKREQEDTEPENVISDTMAYYSYLCERYDCFLEVEKLERTRLSAMFEHLREHNNVLSNEGWETMVSRVSRLSDIAGNITGLINLLKHALAFINTEYDFKRLEVLNEAILRDVDNYTSTRASFICELMYFLSNVSAETVEWHRDLICNHSWAFWHGVEEA